MRRSTHPALTAGVIAAIALTAAVATLSRDGTPDQPPAMGTEITAAAPAPSSAAVPEPAVTPTTPIPAPPSTSAEPSRRPTSDGMVVAVDPETGKLGMPAPGQLGQELSIDEAQAYARQIASELVTEHRADGSSSLKHDERLADYSVVRIGPDGKPVFQCVHGAHAVETALGKDEPVPPALEEE